MRALVTGVNGQLGFDLALRLSACHFEFLGTDIGNPAEDYHGSYTQMDVSDEEQVMRVISDYIPDVVFHCAAWTKVDAAELEENKEMVLRINGEGSLYVAKACRAVGAKMVYISSDYVFNGGGDIPWEPECSTFFPINIYGYSKLVGERNVMNTLKKFFIVRISWAFGRHGGNFVKSMLKLSETRDTLRVVDDQVGRPTYTKDLAKLLVSMSESQAFGIYHACNEGPNVSWADYAKTIFSFAGKNVIVEPVSTDEYGQSVAMRPLNSRLNTQKLERNGFECLPRWEDSLKNYLKEVMDGNYKS